MQLSVMYCNKISTLHDNTLLEGKTTYLEGEVVEEEGLWEVVSDCRSDQIITLYTCNFSEVAKQSKYAKRVGPMAIEAACV